MGNLNESEYESEAKLYIKDYLLEIFLWKKNFDSTIFSNVNLYKTNCCEASFRWAIFTEVDFTRTKLNKANFTGAIFIKVIFDDLILFATNFSGANFTDVKFNNVVFRDTVVLEGVDFSGLELINSVFERQNLSTVKFRNALLLGSEFFECKLICADFSNADLRWATLVDGEFNGANFSGALLSGAKVMGADFSGAYFEWVDLTEKDFQGVKFNQAKLVYTSINLDVAHQYLPESAIVSLLHSANVFYLSSFDLIDEHMKILPKEIFDLIFSYCIFLGEKTEKTVTAHCFFYREFYKNYQAGLLGGTFSKRAEVERNRYSLDFMDRAIEHANESSNEDPNATREAILQMGSYYNKMLS